MFVLESSGMISEPGDSGSREGVGGAAPQARQREIPQRCVGGGALDRVRRGLAGRPRCNRASPACCYCCVTLARSLPLSEPQVLTL